MYTVYSKDNCAYCIAATSLLAQKSLSYREVKLGKDITREEFLQDYPDVRSMPFILAEDGNVIGGFQSLQEYLN